MRQCRCRCRLITLPALGALIFITIRHDVISSGPEQSYLAWEKPALARPPVRRAPRPALCPVHVCSASRAAPPDNGLPLRLHAHKNAKKKKALGQREGMELQEARVSIGPQLCAGMCCCHCIRARALRGLMLSRNLNGQKC